MEETRIAEFKNLFSGLLSGASFETTACEIEIGGDEIDTVQQETALHMEMRLQARNHVYLKKVRLALERIDAGTFNECEDCGDEIGEARLLARPTATMCIHCKEAEEKGEQGLMHKNRYSNKWVPLNVLPLEGMARFGNREDRGAVFSFKMGEPEMDPLAG
jgi:DnaK suppressor protein